MSEYAKQATDELTGAFLRWQLLLQDTDVLLAANLTEANRARAAAPGRHCGAARGDPSGDRWPSIVITSMEVRIKVEKFPP
jgi:hypothetical protein